MNEGARRPSTAAAGRGPVGRGPVERSRPRPKLWLDADPGHDDVFAILVALARADLVGISVVSGNAPLEACLNNALITLQLAGAENVPVHAGAAKPLRRPAQYAPHIHGESGLDGPNLPARRLAPAATEAVPAILAAAASHDDVWLVATGPLTNVAKALAADPGLATRLAGISLMGGSYSSGNITAAAEFNIWADPDAAAAVFESGARLVMAGLDLTHQFMITASRRQQVRALGGELATFTADLLEYFSQAYARNFGVAPEGPLHDPCAVLAVTDPELFTSHDFHVAIETNSDLTRGQTVVDRRPGNLSRTPNATVLERIDDEAAFATLIGAIGSLGAL